MRVNVGVIGLGRIGKLHVENLALRVPAANLVVIAERGEQLDSARNFAERFHVPEVTGDHHEILGNPDIDAVVICTPTGTHSAIIVEAARAGKHIFCEKPIALDLPSVDEALAAVRQAGVKFQVGFNKRFDPNSVQINRSILEGEVGTPHLIHIVDRHSAPPSPDYIKSSGGIFMDVTIHDFDMARLLMDSEVEALTAYGGALVDSKIGEIGDIDTAVTLLKFANGAIGTIETSLQSGYGYDYRVEVLGPGGRTAPLHFSREGYTESYIAEMQAFVEAIICDTPTLVSGADGRAAIVMALAAKKSHLEKRTVQLTEIV